MDNMRLTLEVAILNGKIECMKKDLAKLLGDQKPTEAAFANCSLFEKCGSENLPTPISTEFRPLQAPEGPCLALELLRVPGQQSLSEQSSLLFQERMAQALQSRQRDLTWEDFPKLLCSSCLVLLPVRVKQFFAILAQINVTGSLLQVIAEKLPETTHNESQEVPSSAESLPTLPTCCEKTSHRVEKWLRETEKTYTATPGNGGNVTGPVPVNMPLTVVTLETKLEPTNNRDAGVEKSEQGPVWSPLTSESKINIGGYASDEGGHGPLPEQIFYQKQVGKKFAPANNANSELKKEDAEGNSAQNKVQQVPPSTKSQQPKTLYSSNPSEPNRQEDPQKVPCNGFSRNEQRSVRMSPVMHNSEVQKEVRSNHAVNTQQVSSPVNSNHQNYHSNAYASDIDIGTRNFRPEQPLRGSRDNLHALGASYRGIPENGQRFADNYGYTRKMASTVPEKSNVDYRNAYASEPNFRPEQRGLREYLPPVPYQGLPENQRRFADDYGSTRKITSTVPEKSPVDYHYRNYKPENESGRRNMRYVSPYENHQNTSSSFNSQQQRNQYFSYSLQAPYRPQEPPRERKIEYRRAPCPDPPGSENWRKNLYENYQSVLDCYIRSFDYYNSYQGSPYSPHYHRCTERH